jgi:hypothetical protein
MEEEVGSDPTCPIFIGTISFQDCANNPSLALFHNMVPVKGIEPPKSLRSKRSRFA